MPACACPAACGAPVVTSGGQFTAQAPVHVEVALVSFSNRYNVRPSPAVKKVPSEPFAVVTVATAPAALGAAAGAEEAGLCAARAAVVAAAAGCRGGREQGHRGRPHRRPPQGTPALVHVRAFLLEGRGFSSTHDHSRGPVHPRRPAPQLSAISAPSANPVAASHTHVGMCRNKYIRLLSFRLSGRRARRPQRWAEAGSPGRCTTAPVSALNWLPWHGQLITPLLTSLTVQPWCVQVAEKACTAPDWSRVTTTFALSRTTPPPAGTALTVVSTVPPPGADP